MRILFVSGAGILPEQRINRWKMVSQLYATLGQSFRSLGHQTYYYVHPEAWDETVPMAMTWLHGDHTHFGYVLESFAPDFVFCWNGGSQGDVTTATFAASYNAKMIYSEQGWFPQRSTLYFDFAGTNARCSTRFRSFPIPDEKGAARFLQLRKDYILEAGIEGLFNPKAFEIEKPDFSKEVFVPLQDERDLNIIQDSAFKTMDDFLRYLVDTWPELRFRVRPHPKYPNPKLSKYPNVVMDDPKKPMFQSLSECGSVIGINSTTLLESALLGKTVLSFGESLATGTKLLHDVRMGDELDLGAVDVSTENARSVLAALLNKQMLRDSLGKPLDVLRADIFREMRSVMERKANLFNWL